MKIATCMIFLLSTGLLLVCHLSIANAKMSSKLGEWHMVANSSWWPPDLKMCQEIASRFNERSRSSFKGSISPAIVAPSSYHPHDFVITKLESSVSDDSMNIWSLPDQYDEESDPVNAPTYPEAINLIYQVADSDIVQIANGIDLQKKILLAVPPKASAKIIPNLRAEYLACRKNLNGSVSALLGRGACRTAYVLPIDDALNGMADRSNLPPPDVAWVESPVRPQKNEQLDYLTDYIVDGFVAVTSSSYLGYMENNKYMFDGDHSARVILLKIFVANDTGARATTVSDLANKYRLEPLTCTVQASVINVF